MIRALLSLMNQLLLAIDEAVRAIDDDDLGVDE